jgi:U3 small nucleolar RNA-associated protein 3
VREGGLATAEGVSYLEAKHLLLLHYCASITLYLLLKAEGRPVQAHPVINRLVEIRAYLVGCAAKGCCVCAGTLQ